MGGKEVGEMNPVERAFISLGADVGGKDAHAATHEHILELRKLLAESCQGQYGKVIKEIALVLRIDGSVQAWHRSGVDGVALQRRNSFATADIYITREIWERTDKESFRSFLADSVRNAVSEVAREAQIRGVSIMHADLDRDLCRAISVFLSSRPE
jgi:hypothetical protein